MIKYILLISSLLVSGVTCAEEPDTWIKVTGSDYADFYINPARMVVSDNNKQIVDFWDKSIDLQTIKVGSTNYIKGNYVLAKRQIKCIDRTMKNISRNHYEMKGGSMETYNYPYPQWNEVVPDSVSENLLKQVCNYKFPKITN